MEAPIRVAAIVPAHNEAEHIAAVLSVLRTHASVDEVIVVDDGSADDTAVEARRAGARVVSLSPNRGKGGAMRAGADHTQAEILLYIDADLVGLSPAHIDGLLEPVVADRADMSVGIFAAGRMATDLAQKLAPFLSGQRAMRRSVILSVPGIDQSRYGVEVALERYARQAKLRVQKVPLVNLAQVMKEQKRGVVKGFAARMKMYWEILRAAR